MKNLFLLPCFLVCLIGFCYGADVAYKFTILDLAVEFEGQLDTLRLLDRNNKGEMVGIHEFSASYYVANNKVIQLNCPGDYTIVSAINNAGQIAGSCADGQRLNGFILQRKTGVYTLLSYPDSDGTVVYGINDRGHAVGQYWIGAGLAGYHGFIWKDGVYSTVDAPESNGLFLALHGINKQGQATGTYLRPDAVEISGDISVVGGDEIAFIVDNGSFTFLDYPGGSQTFAMDINNSAQVVGLTYDNVGNQIWFLFDDGQYFRITGLPEDAVFSGLPWGINDRGEIAGSYFERGTFVVHSFVAVPVPVKGARR